MTYAIRHTQDDISIIAAVADTPIIVSVDTNQYEKMKSAKVNNLDEIEIYFDAEIDGFSAECSFRYTREYTKENGHNNLGNDIEEFDEPEILMKGVDCYCKSLITSKMRLKVLELAFELNDFMLAKTFP